MISASARPKSEGGKSDLDTWRAIFQLWVELEVFESLAERKHGELSIVEAEQRLKTFADEIVLRGLDKHKALKVDSSRDALKRFVALNVLILDLKKVRPYAPQTSVSPNELISSSSNM